MTRYLKIQGGWIIEKITREGHPIKITRTLTPLGRERIIKNNLDRVIEELKKEKEE